MSTPLNHPMQAICLDSYGTARFVPNAIVRFLLDAGKFDLNDIALMQFCDEDRAQFAQLIGYSVSGLGELGYASDAAIAVAEQEAERLSQ